MRTQISTDIPIEVAEQLQTAFAAAQTTLDQRTKESYEHMIAALEAHLEKISASWERPMLQLTQALPEWIYPYIQQPDTEYCEWDNQRNESKYTYALINVPGCNPIAAWISPNTNDVRYEVLEPYLHHDDEDDLWYVSDATKWHRGTVYGIQLIGDPDIAVTLFHARDAYLKRLDLEAKAEQRNAYEPETLLVDAPEPAPAPADPDNVDKAGELLAKYNVGLINDATIVVAAQLYAIADQARRIADALERR